MSKHRNTIAVAAAILLLAAAIYLLFREELSGGLEGSDVSVSSTAAEFFNSTMKEDKEGKPVWNLRADHVKIDSDRNKVHLTGIDGFFQNDDLKLTLKAREGVLDRAKQTVYLEGTIEASTSDGAVLHAENLTYYGKTEILSTDKAFMVEKDGRVLTADSFTADRVLNEVKAKGNARLREKGAAQ